MKRNLITINKVVLVGLLVLTNTFSLLSNNYNRTITRKEAADDLEVYFQIIDKQHGNPYQYISRQAFQKLVMDQVASLPDAITFKQFEVLLAELNNTLRCGHTKVGMDRSVVRQDFDLPQFFPLPIKIIQGKAYLDFERSDIPHGAELLSINDEDIPSLLPELINLTVTDGFSETKPLREVESKFGYYYFLKNGASSSFSVSYKDPIGQVRQVVVEGVAGNTMLANNYYRPINMSHERYNRFTNLDAIDSLQTLVLTLNTFQANPDWFDQKLGSRYNEEDKEFDFENLVIDLRINEGGDRRLLNTMYQFLTGNRLNDPSKTYTRSQNIEMKQYVASINGRLKSDESLQGAEDYIQKYFNSSKEDRFEAPLLNWYDEFEGTVDYKGARFEGNVYVLISGRTFSAAADLARILGQMDNVILIGEETGGAHVGRAANMLVNYSLPNTSSTLQVPVIYEEFVNVSADNAGRGTFPDYSVQTTFEDLIEKRDSVFEYTIGLISQRNSFGSN
ncbi:S41 family peptidase [Roseivirga sp. E12]|uniref:S41 family peptidase n=1 Tax=Roseivirga sp. E12 TaxID=2819237 RepID=UPI001ABC281C|nr:S41 family peptidase [Roseivirga sp. E12]MBO3699881.1 hypothetical protein [Roseivirga sp. E12]